MWATSEITTTGDEVDSLLLGSSQQGIMGLYFKADFGEPKTAVQDVTVTFMADPTLDASQAVTAALSAVTLAIAVLVV